MIAAVAFAAVLVAPQALAASSWMHLTTHTAAECAGELSFVYSAYSPARDCSLTSATQTCTSTATAGAASKFAGCFVVEDPSTVNTGSWVPPASRGSLAASTPYLAVTGFPGQKTCDAKNGSVPLVQTAYAASGKCLSMDGVYFKAQCTATAGAVTFCSDSDCTKCSAPVAYASGCNLVNGMGASFTCAVPEVTDATTSSWSGKPVKSAGITLASAKIAVATDAKKNNAVRTSGSIAAAFVAIGAFMAL
ncbi:hypothetical protein BC831DRAFT_474735 [Entophlyctis helioformis]|nr:hypothetical protein BC831DRAFT_474735 [Entophlyctis helioformis]